MAVKGGSVPVTPSANFSLPRIQSRSRDRAVGIPAAGAMLEPKGGVLARIAALLRSNSHRQGGAVPPGRLRLVIDSRKHPEL